MKTFLNKTLRRWILPPEAEFVMEGLDYWRNEIFFQICRLIFFGGVIVYPALISSYVHEDEFHMIWPTTVFTVLVYFIILLKKLNHRIRRWGLIVLFIMIGVYVLMQDGFQGIGFIFLFTQLLLATVFFGKQAVLIGMWINVIILIGMNTLLWLYPDFRIVLTEYQPIFQLAVSAAFLFLSATVTNAIVSLITGLNQTIESERGARTNLEQEIEIRTALQEELTLERQSLQARVEERTSLLAQANEELLKSMKFKDAFFDSIRHEFRTPIHAITGYTDLLMANDDNLTEKQQGYLSRIREAAKNLLNVINDILDTTRIQAGLLNIQPVILSLSEVCQSAFLYIEGDVVKRGLSIKPVDEGCDINLRADPQRFKQILINLLSNGVKYTPEGGSLGVDMIHHKDEVQLVVWDTGIGIPEKDQENIFKPFYRSENRTNLDVEGTGLGLSLAKQLIEAHGWTITVESILNKGSRFIIHIPLRDITQRDATIYY